ncbi:MAG: hypothetical protein ACYC0V_21350 [Armatimonadota bacterium]
MQSFFNSNVFVEIREAIGNLGRRVRKRTNPELVDRIFRKRLAQTAIELPRSPGRFAEPEGEVIDVTYRIINDEEIDDERE